MGTSKVQLFFSFVMDIFDSSITPKKKKKKKKTKLWIVTKYICCSLLVWAGYIGYKTRPWGQGHETKWGSYWEHVGNPIGTSWEQIENNKISKPPAPSPRMKKTWLPEVWNYGCTFTRPLSPGKYDKFNSSIPLKILLLGAWDGKLCFLYI